ncbi:MAG: hypothetical protein K6G81_02580 [Lachnospiraceae bacterium]|nr:hypothetical protein [Lachnospiraceae bacterium]
MIYYYIWERIKGFFKSKFVYLTIVTVIMFSALLGRIYSLQILKTGAAEGQDAGQGAYKTVQMRYYDSTRGNIYDKNGNLLAYNVSSYNLVLGNSALLTKNSEKNAMLYHLIQIIEENGHEVEVGFAIEQNERGELVFNISGNSLLRFKKNAYGLTSVSKLSEEQRNASAQELFDFMRYGNKVSPMFGISDEYSLEDTLKIMALRYELFTIVPQYAQFTICTDIDDNMIAAVMENSAELRGVEVKQVMSRIYNDSLYFAHILGYVGTANEDEIDAMNLGLDDPVYNTSDIVGKTGIEKEMDTVLRGTKGITELSLSSAGKVVSSKTQSSPVAGNDIYLTIDRELQIACYHILENNIAAILKSKIVNSMSYGGKGSSASKITIPIYEVYYSFIDNGLIDIQHFYADDATELERKTYESFVSKRAAVLDKLDEILSYDAPVAGSKLTEEYDGYISYIHSKLRSDKILLKDLINEKDATYIKYTEGRISLSEYLQYAIDMQWVDLGLLGIGDDYNTNEEVYRKLKAYIFERLEGDEDFEKMLYRVMIFSFRISGRDMCLLLYDQGVLEYNENDYRKLLNGRIGAYNFVIEKLTSLEISPGMLALEPCSGSIVITDVRSGDVLAMVTYPSYDNNKLANRIDWDYYSSLLENKATPLLNRATQQMTATGSTFKPLMSLAGLGEGIITTSTKIQDKGIFEEVDPSPKCWKYPGNHGWINLTQAIQHSCNYFFYTLGYQMALDGSGEYSDSLGISKIQKYASMFGLSTKSGVEVPETMPSISSIDAVRTSIGYYHNFSPVQISRYVTAIANRGTVYNMTIVDKLVDKDENIVVDNSATVYNDIDMYTNEEWSAVQKGMYDVVNTGANNLNHLYGDLGFKVAGKTGTAQVSLTHPSHGLFVSFAPFSAPEVSVTVVLPNGYASANAAKLAREVYGLYFNEENKEALLSGDLTTTNVTSISVSD